MIEIIEYCGPDLRFARESYYLNLFKPANNLVHDVTPFSAETILKMSENHPRSKGFLCLICTQIQESFITLLDMLLYLSVLIALQS